MTILDANEPAGMTPTATLSVDGMLRLNRAAGEAFGLEVAMETVRVALGYDQATAAVGVTCLGKEGGPRGYRLTWHRGSWRVRCTRFWSKIRFDWESGPHHFDVESRGEWLVLRRRGA